MKSSRRVNCRKVLKKPPYKQIDKLTIIAPGKLVVLTKVDIFGYLGRDNHPSRSDINTICLVLRSHVLESRDDGDGFVNEFFHEDVGSTWELKYGDMSFYDVVCVNSSKRLELVEHELKELDIVIELAIRT